MEWFLKVVKQNYANFEGRARRKEYWMFILWYLIIYMVPYILGIIMANISGGLAMVFFGVAGLFSLAVLVPTIAVGVRRMHDVGKSGWFILIPIYSLILAITEGDKGDNEYGPDPKAGEQQ